MSERIKAVKVKSPWGNVTWDAFADGHFVGNCRLRAEAIKVAEARLENDSEATRRLGNEINDVEQDAPG